MGRSSASRLQDVDAEDGDEAGFGGAVHQRVVLVGRRDGDYPRLPESTREYPRVPEISWLGVVTILTEPSLATASHAHPDPNTPAAAAENCALKSSYEPNACRQSFCSQSRRAPQGDWGRGDERERRGEERGEERRGEETRR